MTGKIQIVEESLAGENIASATVRRYGIANGLLFLWRREYREGHLGGDVAGAGFLPAFVVNDDVAGKYPQPAKREGRIEIALTNGCRVFVNNDLGPQALSGVLSALEAR